MTLSARALPARLDALQSVSGLLLALFMWAHMLLVSSILISEEAMYRVARMFEGYYLFGRAHPWLVSVVVALVLLLMMLHAALALRKFPHSAGQYGAFRVHQRRMRHGDTTLWWWQVATGFLLFFLAPMHLFGMFSQPDQIGPYASAARVYHTHWPLYLVLLFAVELHGAIGLYRLALKWVVLPGRPPQQLRHRLNLLKWGLSVFFITLGLCTLLAYFRLGEQISDRPGLRYPPAIEVNP
ncbi:fumarate reductase cytochrome b subunit [Parahaliea maris]|uniref:Fumarate reductase cytochrome b subunit n=1 Tax=Parahaliea maris TaxID=2716870 RepID=A0A5C9A4I6_9GAMM|nr:fumarate reductase cytochrome b subunit [Parahaliea maris]TXS95698.1 fumarate reductase cytochrome b subunit [Parahaliea maris]